MFEKDDSSNGQKKANGCSFQQALRQNSPPFKRWACFYVTISGNSERFQYFNFEVNFRKPFSKNWSTVFS